MRTATNVARAAVTLAFALAGAAPLSASANQSTFDVTVLAGACANCHGTDGRSPGGIPSIAGRPESALLSHLRAFKSETPPPGTTIMDRLTRGFSDEELQALAKHFSQIKAQPGQGAR
ncbi:MAG TPA: c-type cytochrome [Pusillimonas sp.]|uniref:c-type cytochrome n=1 Tax=unclassified Pusillimonas TaxID=2640016 RepID=UPI0026313AC8|nr:MULTISPECIES: c-type cytochrome [unclassified Pusillimonas]HLU18585.1 c-type cytochrome [Pusillimonas sp.]